MVTADNASLRSGRLNPAVPQIQNVHLKTRDMIAATNKYINHLSLSLCVLLALGTELAIAEEGGKKTGQIKDSALGRPVEIMDKRLSDKELEKFLESRTTPGVLGSLSSYSSLLFAIDSVALRADNEFQWPGELQLYSPFPDSYRPQWKEKLDMIARQIGAKWSYNHDTGYWMLHPGPMPYPYTVKIAEGWKQRDQGNHVVFVPPIAKVGMDIYVLGHYTPTAKDGTKLFEEARAQAAMMWASRIKEGAAIEQMETRKVDGEDALYFQSPTPRSADLIWRQWSVVKNGWSILIVSVIHGDNEAALRPQVEAMVNSVRIGGVKAPQSKDEHGGTGQPAATVKSKAE